MKIPRNAIVLAALTPIVGLTLSPLVGFIAAAARLSTPQSTLSQAAAGLASSAVLRALSFTMRQAFASTAAAVVIGFPGAWLVARYEFKARKIFLALSAIPFCLPPVMVILAFVLYYGHSGIFTRFLVALGFSKSQNAAFLYGFWGLVFVQAFYNFPIILQTLGAYWSRLPVSREEAARTLGASKLRAFATGTLPALLPPALQAASLVFLFCFFSFTLVLVFGGLAGSTLEVDIYRAVRFSGDGRIALSLALVQTLAALLVVSIFMFFERKTSHSLQNFGAAPPRKPPRGLVRLVLFLYALLIVLFFLGPLFAIVMKAFSVRSFMGGPERFGFSNFADLIGGFQAPLPRALLNSVVVSAFAAAIASILGLFAAAAASASTSIINRSASNSFEEALGRKRPISAMIFSTLPLAVSPALLAIGWGSIAVNADRLILILAQASLAWPFVARSLGAAFDSIDPGRRRAARTLGANRLKAFILVDAPTILPSIASSAAFAFSIAAGDVNIPLILGSGKFETLPLLMYRLTSAYRFNEACAAGLVLAILTGVVFALKEGDENVP